MANETKLLNVRVEQEFIDQLDKAAEKAGVSRSTFMRQAIADAVNGTTRGAIDQPHPEKAARVLQVQTKQTAEVIVCSHPKSDRQQLAYGTFCRACGKRIR